MPTTHTILTDDADNIASHANRTRQMPPMYRDQLTGKIVAEIPIESRDAFLADDKLQAFLSAKKAVWRVISDLRNKGGRHV